MEATPTLLRQPVASRSGSPAEPFELLLPWRLLLATVLVPGLPGPRLIEPDEGRTAPFYLGETVLLATRDAEDPRSTLRSLAWWRFEAASCSERSWFLVPSRDRREAAQLEAAGHRRHGSDSEFLLYGGCGDDTAPGAVADRAGERRLDLVSPGGPELPVEIHGQDSRAKP